MAADITVLAAALVAASSRPTFEEADKRARELVGKMTLEEKIDYIGGNSTIQPLERLGIPEVFMSDGPMGCRDFGLAACFAGGIALAASWNPRMALEMGIALGQECRANGAHIILAPAVNIHRAPHCGRNFEYMGEDPYLAATMVVPLIEGIQSQETMATIKHYACNNQEWERHKVSSEVDDRTLREIYLPAFKAAVEDGRVACVMSSYNLLNGIHASENEYLLKTILRDEWGFQGILMSDWDSTYNAVNAVNHGLDLEMPKAKIINRESIMPAVQDGRVKESTIDEKVLRILRTAILFRCFDRPRYDESVPRENPKSREVALKGAREGIVLLKNENNVLPLDRSKVRSMMVMGPNARMPVYCGGGSAYTRAFDPVSILEGVRAVAGSSIRVDHYPESIGFTGKIRMEVYENEDFEGPVMHEEEVEEIDFNWTRGKAPGLEDSIYFAARFNGKLHAEKSGKYSFFARVDDGIRVYLDGKLVMEDWNRRRLKKLKAVAQVEAGDHDLLIEYFRAGMEAMLEFGCSPFLTPDEEAEMLSKYDAVVYCGGFNELIEGEGYDRTYELPDDQAEEIRAVAEANPNTIVVLNAGGGVDWQPWLDKVPAVLHAWYSGMEAGRATAEILFGDVNPSGKLPVSLEKKWEDNPTAPYYHINDNLTTPYTEGIFVGYRGYDKDKKEPQFEFGHGLSYTTFEFGDLAIKETGCCDRQIEVSCTVTNTGDREGGEVAQLYVSDVECSVPRPVRELKGFRKVFLRPGQKADLSFVLTEKDLSFYDVKSKSWVAEPGKFKVYIGSSSRRLPLQGEFNW